MSYRNLTLKVDGAVARLLLHSGAEGNRLDRDCLSELAAACAEITERPSVSVVLVEAAGSDFCLGWQPEAVESLRRDRPNNAALLDPFGCFGALAVPVMVALQGRVLSAGLELALATDLRVAADDAGFALPEAGLGELPQAGGSVRLPRIVGRGRATSMLLLGEEVDAQAALSAGLVSRLFPTGSLASEARALAARIAERGPLALRYVKDAVRQGSEMPLDQALRYELDLSIILQTTRDRAEGVRAFLEKRPPRFEGR